MDPARAPRRRLTDRVRELADQAWEHGQHELSDNLHQVARLAEGQRRLWTDEERRRRLAY
jgi:hypothetical protein